MILNHICESCDSEFTLNYDDLVCEDAPSYCPFCGDYLDVDEDDFENEED